MLRVLIVLSIFLSICSALPSENLPEIAPPNCPEGQEWVNGDCNWKTPLVAVAPLKVPSDIDVQNMITVPPNCPPGQQWINGQCRDVWRGGALADSEVFQKLVQNLWAKIAPVRNNGQEEVINSYNALPKFQIEDDPNRNIISVPNQCPEGYKPDALGICRPKL